MYFFNFQFQFLVRQDLLKFFKFCVAHLMCILIFFKIVSGRDILQGEPESMRRYSVSVNRDLTVSQRFVMRNRSRKVSVDTSDAVDDLFKRLQKK